MTIGVAIIDRLTTIFRSKNYHDIGEQIGEGMHPICNQGMRMKPYTPNKLEHAQKKIDYSAQQGDFFSRSKSCFIHVDLPDCDIRLRIQG